MSLFHSSVHQDIKSGNMTLTFRLWDSCKLKKGASYPVEKLGRILIKDARKVTISSISNEEAKRAGYKNAADIRSIFQKKNPDMDAARDLCFRIEFQYIGNQERGTGRAAHKPLSRIMLDKLDEKLKRLDRKAQGITYSAILKEMSKTAHSRIKKLVGTFDCEFSEMRRKLNRLMSEKFVDVDSQNRFRLTERGAQLIKHREVRIAELIK